MDKNGNQSDKNCSGCKLVCKKCQAGYYLKKKNYKCKKIPKNCDQVNTNTGKCTKCKSGFKLKGNACQKNKWTQIHSYNSILEFNISWSQYLLYFFIVI